MSDKSKLLQNERAVIEKMEAEYKLKETILGAMGDVACPVSIGAFGYCAEVSLFYKSPASSLADLFKAMPPIPLSLVKGSSVTVKPEESLRESDEGYRRKVFPLIFKSGKGASTEEGLQKCVWWTKLGGKTVSVEAEGSLGEIITLMGDENSRYSPESYSYSTGSTGYLLLRHKSADDIELLSPMEKWHASWKVWMDSHEWNEKQKIFVRCFHSWAEHSDNVIDTPTQESYPALWRRVGDMNLSFTPDEIAEIVAFSNARQSELPDAKAEASRCLEIAEVWLQEFFSTKGNPFNSRGVNRVEIRFDAFEYFQYLFRKETGLPGSINWVSSSFGNSIEIGYTVDKEHIRVYCEYLKDAPSVDWDSMIEYH